jgi:sodium/potassium-transporting ATPase subunit alpha
MRENRKNVTIFRKKFQKIFEIPFNSNLKYQVNVYNTVESDNKSELLVVILGAPEIIVEKCSSLLIDNKAQNLDTYWRSKIENACNVYAKSGERVIAVCSLRLDPKIYNKDYKFQTHHQTQEPNFELANMKFMGLVAMIDPPRPGVADAVAKCKSAGIKVVMITGNLIF